MVRLAPLLTVYALMWLRHNRQSLLFCALRRGQTSSHALRHDGYAAGMFPEVSLKDSNFINPICCLYQVKGKLPMHYREAPRKASTDWPPRFMKVRHLPSQRLPRFTREQNAVHLASSKRSKRGSYRNRLPRCTPTRPHSPVPVAPDRASHLNARLRPDPVNARPHRLQERRAETVLSYQGALARPILQRGRRELGSWYASSMPRCQSSCDS